MYVLHPNLLLQVIIDFGDKEISSDNWVKVQSPSWKVYRRKKRNMDKLWVDVNLQTGLLPYIL